MFVEQPLALPGSAKIGKNVCHLLKLIKALKNNKNIEKKYVRDVITMITRRVCCMAAKGGVVMLGAQTKY